MEGLILESKKLNSPEEKGNDENAKEFIKIY